MNTKVVEEISNHAELRMVMKGDIIFEHGSKVNACAIIMTGKVYVKLHNKDGTSVIAYSLEKDDYFADLDIVMGEGSYHWGSYIAEENTQLILLLKENFEGDLIDRSLRILRGRYKILKKSGICQSWDTNEIMRLARMINKKVYGAGKELVTQNENSNHMFILTSGIVGVFMKPSLKNELLSLKLEKKQALKNIGMKYTYHHSERGLKTSKDPSLISQGIYITPDFLNRTPSERRQFELRQELQEIEDAISRLDEDETNKLENKPFKVTQLMPIGIFGEGCILEPDDPIGSLARGTFKAQTRVEVLEIHKNVMQTFQIGNKTLRSISLKRVIFPESAKVEAEMQENESWNKYKDEVQKLIVKTRWPILPQQLIELPSGRSMVKPKEDLMTCFNFSTV